MVRLTIAIAILCLVAAAQAPAPAQQSQGAQRGQLIIPLEAIPRRVPITREQVESARHNPYVSSEEYRDLVQRYNDQWNPQAIPWQGGVVIVNPHDPTKQFWSVLPGQQQQGGQQQQQSIQGNCVSDYQGQMFCPPPGGGIQKDTWGRIVCGRGQCTQDSWGQIICSSQYGGYVTKKLMGQIQCTGGCEQASSGICQSPR
jgi:hypothetical protein